MTKNFTFIDLFSGAGGFTEGMLLSGNSDYSFKLIAASDIHINAKLTHENRFKHGLNLDYSFILKDIRNEEIINELLKVVKQNNGKEEIDVVVGGPPCQGFSVFGARQENDPRNNLFLPYLKIIQALNPRYFVMENVPGLATMYKGKVVKQIYQEVYQMKPNKYKLIGPLEVNAVHYGVPQSRPRILFIGYRSNCSPIWSISPNTYTMPKTVENAIGDLAFLRPWERSNQYEPNYVPNCDYQKESRTGRLFEKLGIKRKDLELNNHEAAKHTPEVIARFAMMEPGYGFESIPKNLWEKHLHSSKKWCQRLDPKKPSFTVLTLPDDFVHYKRPRTLTVREMARLQSFDDTFTFCGPRTSGGGGKGNKKRTKELPQYTQVGNAVPPLLAKAIGDSLIQALTVKL